MIEVKGITKRFGPTTAVDDITFSIAKGEVVGFLGPNGAGKTTTMRILTCFLPADVGEAKVAGFDVLEQSMEVRSRIGYLPESAPLYLDMQVNEFLDYVGSIRGLKGADKTAAIDRMIEVCGLSGVMVKQIGELSKGYRQRVGLAQAMIHNPEILVLDEPTSGLDPNQIREIRDLIRTLGKEKTVILSTHILPEVEATCSRVVIINRGKIVADGSIEEISLLGGGGNLHVILARGDRGRIESGLKTLTDVAGFKAAGQEDGVWRFEIQGRPSVHLGEQLFRLAADSGFSLAELRREKTTLESIFADLTLAKKEAGETSPAGEE